MIGGARAQYHLRQSLVFLNADTLNKPEIMIGQAMMRINGEAGTVTDEDTRRYITAQLQALADRVRKNREIPPFQPPAGRLFTIIAEKSSL